MVEIIKGFFDSITLEYGLLVFVLCALVCFFGFLLYIVIKHYLDNSKKTTTVLVEMELAAKTNNERLDSIRTEIKVIKGVLTVLASTGKLQATDKGGQDNASS